MGKLVVLDTTVMNDVWQMDVCDFSGCFVAFVVFCSNESS